MLSNARLESLKRQHKLLEAEIADLQGHKSADTLDIWTLKRKKLEVKEQIEAMRRHNQ